jgi:hypothetical protein
MDVEGDGRDFKGCVFGFPCPDERGVKMRVVCISFLAGFAVGVRGYKTDGRIVAPVFAYLYYCRCLLNLFSFTMHQAILFNINYNFCIIIVMDESYISVICFISP